MKNYYNKILWFYYGKRSSRIKKWWFEEKEKQCWVSGEVESWTWVEEAQNKLRWEWQRDWVLELLVWHISWWNLFMKIEWLMNFLSLKLIILFHLGLIRFLRFNVPSISTIYGDCWARSVNKTLCILVMFCVIYKLLNKGLKDKNSKWRD